MNACSAKTASLDGFNDLEHYRAVPGSPGTLSSLVDRRRAIVSASFRLHLRRRLILRGRFYLDTITLCLTDSSEEFLPTAQPQEVSIQIHSLHNVTYYTLRLRW